MLWARLSLAAAHTHGNVQCRYQPTGRANARTNKRFVELKSGGVLYFMASKNQCTTDAEKKEKKKKTLP
jgi:hypothetical protein